jgi:hypothetical protein
MTAKPGQSNGRFTTSGCTSETVDVSGNGFRVGTGSGLVRRNEAPRRKAPKNKLRPSGPPDRVEDPVPHNLEREASRL